MPDQAVPHNCRQLSDLLPDNPALRIKVVLKQSGAFLEHTTFAIDQDVRSGEAQAVGEWLGSVELKIEFCPFCGRNFDSLSPR